MVQHVDMVLVACVADILRRGEPSPFARMAWCRHELRRALITVGCTWTVADWTAEVVVLAALDMIGARWPSWREAQSDYCQDGTLILRQSCRDCGKPLLNDWDTKFCDAACRQRWHSRVARTWLRKDADAYGAAVRTTRGLDEQHVV